MNKAFPLAIIISCLSFLNCSTNAQTPIDTSLPPLKEPIITAPIFNDVWDTSDIDISYIGQNKKLVAFTFDDAPAHYLENLLAVFASFNEQNPDCKATATIFYNGKNFDENTTQLLHASLSLGFELGNHTYSHKNLTTLSKELLRQEIDKTDELLKQIDKKSRHLLRAPYGSTNELVKQTVDVPIINWTIDTLDWTGKSEREIYQTVQNNLFDGAIVLMHDGYKNTLSAIKRLLPALKEQGYQAVSVSALAKAHSVPMKKGNTYIRLRKGR